MGNCCVMFCLQKHTVCWITPLRNGSGTIKHYLFLLETEPIINCYSRGIHHIRKNNV